MKAGIALGSNIEPRLLHLQAARRRIFELHDSSDPVACSKVYETSPVDCPEGSGAFLNAVLEITTHLAPAELLSRLQAIEQELGRPSEHGHNAPRPIDLDILYCDGLVLDEPGLTLPHPRLSERRFVLQPLADIRPELILPNQDRSIGETLKALASPESVVEFCGAVYESRALPFMTTTLEKFRQSKAAGHKFASLTAYDYPLGRLLDGLDLDFILVGDSLGMVVLGHPDTTQVTLDHMVHHTQAVANGAKQTLIVADLPAHTADVPETAVRNARTLIAAGAGAVKLEGGVEMIPSIRAIVAEGIPVLGHIGMLPQRVREEGGYRIKGKTPQQADQLKEDARALDEAGVFAMVLELVSPALAEEISGCVKSPTIGIGSGQGCDGQILVTYDLLGMFPWFKPRFVTPKANLAENIQTAVTEYVREIREPRKD